MKLSKELKEKIHVWAEGSDELEELLLACNLNDLKTFACCKGHKEKPIYDPYVGIYLNEDKKDLIIDLCINTLKEPDSSTLFHVYEGKKKFSLHQPNFSNLTNIINNPKENNQTDEFERKVFSILLDNMNSNDLKGNIIEIKNSIIFEFIYSDTENNYNKNFKVHNDILEKLPNIELHRFEKTYNDQKYVKINHHIFFKNFKEMFEYILKYQNEIFNLL